MTFRRRLALSCAGAVAVAVILGSILAYVIVRGTLRGQIDTALLKELPRFQMNAPPPGEGGLSVLGSSQQVIVRQIPKGADVSGAAIHRAMPAPQDMNTFADRTIDGTHVRVYTTAVGGNTFQAFRSLAEVDGALSQLRLALALLTLAGIALAIFLSRLATRTAVRPVAQLTEAAEHVATTSDLSRRIEAHGEDEVSRLARAFNTMLEALQRSQHAQRRLVADASHELRTPLTSLRTNMEVMARGGPPDPEDRDRLRHDVVVQLEELTELVGDLVELARDDEPEARPEEDVRFDELVAAAVVRAKRHAPHVRFDPELEPTLIRGVPARLDRAVANLLDNAAKWSPPGSAVEVRLRAGELTVRDHGPGIAPGERALVFERFYRAAEARGRPGSGLGLAIVRQVAESHGATVTAEAAEGQGALLRMRLSAIP
jgi:two-component system sensor histidine kinase MprB